jgi:putative transposase
MLLSPLRHSLWTVLRRIVGKAEERFKRWTKPATLLEEAVADLLRTKPELIAENALLRQQLIVLERQVKHPTFTPFDRGLLVVLASRLPHWKQALLIVKPETLLKWHRCGFKLFWRHKSQGQVRQPRIDERQSP